MRLSLGRKILTAIALVAIIAQSFSPYTANFPQKTYAQETTPVVEQPTPTPDEITPAITGTPSDQTVTPAPDQTTTPTVTPTPEVTNEPTPTATVDEAITVTPTPADNLSPPAQNQNSQPSPQTTPSAATPTPTLAPAENPTGNEELSMTILKNTAAPTVNLDMVVSEGSASLTTDKPDYAPTDTALITGSNLLPNTIYTLTVSSSDEPPTSTTVTVTSDNKGVFAYAYQLDGNYRPDYKAELKDSEGNVVASTSFTDASYTVGTYSSNSYGMPKTAFNRGETVYAKGTSTNAELLRAVLTKPNNDFVTSCDNGGFSKIVTCEYTLQNNSPAGTWHASVQKCSFWLLGCWSWTNKETVNFTVVADTTPPVISKTITGTVGNNSWYTSDVNVNWSATDSESAVVIDSGCGIQAFTNETTGTDSSCVAHSAGGSADDSVNIKIDKTGPSAKLVVTAGTLGTNDWYTSDITVATSCYDTVSAIESYTSDQYQTTDTAGQVFNGQCTNKAGLSTNAAPLTIKLDKTIPEITLNSYNHNWTNQDITVTASTNEGTLNATSHTFTANGSFTFTATDEAGNSSSRTVTITNIDKEGPPETTITAPHNGDYFNATPITNSWDSVTDVSGIVKYQVGYVYDDLHTFSGSTCSDLPNGGCRDVAGNVTSRSHTPNISEQGGVTIYVRAIDGAGNTGAWSSPVHYTYDSIAPTTPILNSPVDDFAIKGVAFNQTWYPVSDAVLYEYQSCYTDPGDSSAPCNNVKYDISQTSTTKHVDAGQPDSLFWWRVRAKDAANNWSNWSESRKLIIDNTGPTVPAADPVAGDYNVTSLLVTLISTDSGSGLAGIYYTTDGTTTPDKNSTPYSGSITVDQDMTIKAIAYDNAGNESSVLSATYGVLPIISNEHITGTGDNSLVITWTTNFPTTSRVVYDTTSHPTPGSGPNYGYAYSTGPQDTSPKVTNHSVTINGLDVNQTYYYRVISGGSPEAVGEENPFTTRYTFGLPGDGLSDGGSTGNGGGAPSLPGVLGVSTALAFGGAPEEVVLGAGIQPEVLGAATGSATPTPSVSSDEPKQTLISSSVNWVLNPITITLVILILLAVITYFIYRKRRNSQ